jgi:hypothetical protein
MSPIEMLLKLLMEVDGQKILDGNGLDSVKKASPTQLIIKWSDGQKALVSVKPIEV